MKIQNRFQAALQQALRKRLFPAKSQAARDWFREHAKSVTANINRQAYIREGENSVVRKKIVPTTVAPGEMIFYNYDPKWKDILDVYDTFPLVFPFTVEQDRFWGVNLHYLPHKERAELLDILYTIVDNKKFSKNTKLSLSYKVLKNIAKKELYAPAIHCYLKKHIKSQIKHVPVEEWDWVSFLQLARWRGKKAGQMPS